MGPRNSKGQFKTKSPAALSWFKNVGKSLGFTSMELVQQMLPSTIEFTTNNAQTVKEIYDDIKSSNKSNRRLGSVLKTGGYNEILKTAIKNSYEDIKSGKFYNKERQNAVYGDESDFALSDDFNFDFDDNDATIIPVQQNITNVQSSVVNRALVKTLNSQTRAIVETAENSDRVAVSLATTKLIADKKFTTNLLKGVDSINNNLGLLVNFQSESMTKYIGASLKYYEESITALNSTLEEIKKSNTIPTSETKLREQPMDMALLSNGTLNIKGYTQLISKQFKDALNSNIFLSPIKDMFSDKDTLKYLTASPLSFISTKMITMLVPGMLKTAMKDLDKTFSGFFPAMLMKINRLNNSSNPLLQLLGQIFGINTPSKSYIDMSQYAKGHVPFDGYTKKAITDVIPGYLRKILAALNGKEELGFDYEKGEFNSIYQMNKDFKDRENRMVLNEFSEVINELKDKIGAMNIDNRDDKKSFEKGIEQFFIALSKKSHLVNPFNEEDFDNELNEVYRFGDNSSHQRWFRQMILSLPRNQIMRAFGMNVLNARKERDRLYQTAEQNQLQYNAALLNNKLGYDEHLDRDQETGKYTVKKGHGFLPVDRYNLNSLDYLRDIKSLLLKGIIVFPDKPIHGRGGSRNVPDHISISLDRMNREATRALESSQINRLFFNTSSDVEIDNARSQGRVTIPSFTDSAMSDEEIAATISLVDDERRRTGVERRNQQNNILKWAGKFLSGNSQSRYNDVIQKVENLLQKPAQLLSGVLNTIDESMFRIVFGDKKDGSQPSFVSQVMTNLKFIFKQFGGWLKNDIINPLHENLFGENGIFNKVKNSDFYKNMVKGMGKMADFVFGKATGENGKREGGLMSDTANQFLDIFDSAKYYFTGKSYTNRAGVNFPNNEQSVFGHMKGMLTNFKDTMKEYLFGKEGKPGEKISGALTGIVGSLKQGFQNFADAIFGPKNINGVANRNYIAIGELTTELKKRAPKALAWGMTGGIGGLLLGGKLGLLGSLFLPGGPVGGAVLGTTLGFLSESERFKSWVFGRKDADGNRVGGIISKKVQEFMKKNKVGIIGGAAVGVSKSLLRSIGLLPSFLLPGGPITGALMGVGLSIATKSETFQKLMFGKKGEDGLRNGGIIGKIFGKAKGRSNILGNMGAGAIGGAALGLIGSKFGLLGSIMLGGPMGGVIGAAAGLVLSIERWKKTVFGEFDDKTGIRKGGVFGKLVNWINVDVIGGLQNTMKELRIGMKNWFLDKIAEPVQIAIEPMKKAIKDGMTKFANAFKTIGEKIQTTICDGLRDYVFKPFADFTQKWIFNPIKGVFKLLFKGAGALISLPFKGLAGLANRQMRKDRRQGLNAYVQSGWEYILDFEGRKERGEKLGFGNALRTIGDIYFNRERRESARRGQEDAFFTDEYRERARNRNIGAYYQDQVESEAAGRKEKRDKEKARDKMLITARRNRRKKIRQQLSEHDYESFYTGEDGETYVLDRDRGYISQKRYNKIHGINDNQATTENGAQLMLPAPVMENLRTITQEVNHLSSMNESLIQIRHLLGGDGGPTNQSDNSSGNPLARLQQVSSGGAPALTNSFQQALERFDEGDDKEEEQKSKYALYKGKIADKYKMVSRKNASFLQEQQALLNEKRLAQENTATQLSLLRKIADNSQEHKEGFLSMFGKKGLLALGLLAALPLIPKIKDFLSVIAGGIGNLVSNLWGWMTGKTNEARKDADGTQIENSSFKEATSRGAVVAVKKGSHIAKKVIEKGKNTIVVAKDVAQGAKNAAKAASKAPGVGKVVETVSESKEKVITKIKVMIEKIVTSLFSFFEKHMPGAAKALTSVKNIIGKIFSKATILKYFTRLSSGLGKVALSSSTFLIADIAFAGYGLITGAFEAARLFKIRENEVDGTMITISAIMKGITNVSWFFLIDIINSIVEEVTATMNDGNGVDFLTICATNIYKVFSSDKDDIKLDQLQDSFVQDWKDYNSRNNSKLSLAAYNDKVNKTVSQKVSESIDKVVEKVKNFNTPGNSYIAKPVQQKSTTMPTTTNIFGKYTNLSDLQKDISKKNQTTSSSALTTSFSSTPFTSSTNKNNSVLGYSSLADLQKSMQNKTGGNGETSFGGFGEEPSKINNFAYYSQNDSRWGNTIYDHSNGYGKSSHPFLKDRGCGPTSMAMVATQLTGKQYGPQQMAQIAQNNGHSTSSGTSWSFFDDIAQRFSLNMAKFSPATQKAALQSYLQSGIPVILSGKRQTNNINESPFTQGGHFVVAVGNDGANKIKINDPRGASYSHSYDINQVTKESAAGWAFNYKGGPLPSADSFASSSNSSNDTTENTSYLSDVVSTFRAYVDSIMGTTTDESSRSTSSSFNNITYGGDKYTSKNLTQFNSISQDQLNSWINSRAPANSPFRNQAAVFLEASKQSGLDPRYIVAHAALESAWGTSKIAKDKNNYFGIGAFNSSPYSSALTFNTGLASGIIGGANWIKKNYVDRGQNSLYSMIYGDPTHRYAVHDDGTPNESWMKNIASIMATAPDGGGFGEMVEKVSKKTNPYNTEGLQYKRELNMMDSNVRKIAQDSTSVEKEFLEKAIDVLKEIANNTGHTSTNVKELLTKDFSSIETRNSTNVNVNPSSSNKATNINPNVNITSQKQNSQQNKDYMIASKIAQGRIK